MSKHVVTHVCVERSEGDCEVVHAIPSGGGDCVLGRGCVSAMFWGLQVAMCATGAQAHQFECDRICVAMSVSAESL